MIDNVKTNSLRIATLLNNRKLWSCFPVPPLSCQFSPWFLPSKSHLSVNWISFLCRLHWGEKYTIVKDKQDKMILILFSVNFRYWFKADKVFEKLFFSSLLLITCHASQVTFRDQSSLTEFKRGTKEKWGLINYYGGGGGLVRILQSLAPPPLNRWKGRSLFTFRMDICHLRFLIIGLDTDRQEHFAITCGLSGDQNVTNQTVNTEGAIIRHNF